MGSWDVSIYEGEDWRGLCYAYSYFTKLMQLFLGAALFFKGFIPSYSAITAPLYEMCKSKFNWNSKTWDRDFIKDLETMKEQRRGATTIYFPDYDLDWILHVDSSEALEAYWYSWWMMARSSGSHPLAFVSRKFTDQAKRWDLPKKEAFALFWGVFSLAYCLRDKPFVLETDYRNWVYIEKSQVPMITRWRIYLQSFQIVIRHIHGKVNIVAYWMSRNGVR